MSKKASNNPADYIVPLNINHLEGRMLHMPNLKGEAKEILFVYGHHSTLERWWGMCQGLNHIGAVTMPDLPGFGGMDSFYTIGKKPTIDNMADYLAAFIKLRYKRKKVVIAGLSFGFVIVTRMLQRYPELTKHVSMLVSIVGFAHYQDFTFSKPRRLGYLVFAAVISRRLPAFVFRHTILQPIVLRNFYGRTHNAKHKYAQADDAEALEAIKDFEVLLWHANDPRTWAFTSAQFLRLDNCKVRVSVPIWHLATKKDNYFDPHVVEQHMRVIFSDFHSVPVNVDNHAPSVMADEKMAAPFLPPKLRQALRRAPS